MLNSVSESLPQRTQPAVGPVIPLPLAFLPPGAAGRELGGTEGEAVLGWGRGGAGIIKKTESLPPKAGWTDAPAPPRFPPSRVSPVPALG